MSEPCGTNAAGWDPRCFASFVRFLESIANGHSGGRLLERDGVVASIAPASPERSLWNSVAYESPDALAAAIDEIRSEYQSAGVLAWTVWTPESDTSTSSLLAGRGHRLDARPRSMQLLLSEIPDRIDGELDYTGSGDWRVLCAINDAAYAGIPEGSFEAGFGSKPDAAYRTYVARFESWDASALATLDHQTDCGVYAVATLPEARRHRLAGRLLHQALLDARERGCETSTLQSSEVGRSVYERLGYRDLGALEMWEHRVFAE